MSGRDIEMVCGRKWFEIMDGTKVQHVCVRIDVHAQHTCHCKRYKFDADTARAVAVIA